MKLIISTIFSFILGLTAVKAQQNTTQVSKKSIEIPALSKAEQDSLDRDKRNGTILH